MGKTKPAHPAKHILGRLRSIESPSAIASTYHFSESEVLAAREIVRHIGEHQAPAASRLPELLVQAMVEAAIQIEHAPFLQAMAEQGVKCASNAAKRGLSILRSRGFDVEISSFASVPHFPPLFPQVAEVPCFITTSDSDGEHALWVALSLPYGGLQVTVVLYSDISGILHVESDEMGRKSFRELTQKLVAESSFHDVLLRPISLSRAKGYLGAAHLLTPHGLSVEKEAQIHHLLGNPRDAFSSTQLKLQPLAVLNSQLVAKSYQLHDEPEIKPWVPDSQELVQSLRDQLEQIFQSALFMDETQKQEHAQQLLTQKAESFFDSRVRKRYSQRLHDLAEAFQVVGRTEAAELAQYTALVLSSDLETSPLPFCLRLFEKLLEPGSQALPGQKDPPTKGFS